MLALAKRFFKPYGRYLFWGPATKVLEVCFDLMVPLVVAWMVDSGIRAHSVTVVWQGGLALVVMAVLGFASTLVCQKMASITCTGVASDLRRALFARAMEFAPADFDDFGAPTLITRTTNDVNQVQTAVSMLIRQVIRWPFLAVGSLVCALAIDWRMGLVFCVSMPLIALVFYVVMGRSVPYFASMQKALDRVALICRETLGGVRPIRAFGQWGRQRARFQEAAARQASIAVESTKLTGVLDPATFLVMNLGIACVLVIGANQVMGGVLEQGQVMAFIGYMNQLLVSIVYVANLVVIFTRAHASATRIMEVIDHPVSLTYPAGEKPANDRESRVPATSSANGKSADTDGTPVIGGPSHGPVLRFRNVSFTFPDATVPALQAIDFDLGAGEVLGVIGGTGSGKSTLASVAARLFDATEGTVELLGRPIGSYDEKTLRHAVALVPQRARLMEGTLRENLRWRDGEATDAELQEALDRAQATFIADLPAGLDTPVEAGGMNFSGGQRQRLAIARALVGPSALLIMDDSTSALDYETDAALRRALAALPGHPARLVIAQRVASVRHATKILVLDHGAPAGLGTHDELLATCPLYQEICRSQAWEEKEVAAL